MFIVTFMFFNWIIEYIESRITKIRIVFLVLSQANQCIALFRRSSTHITHFFECIELKSSSLKNILLFVYKEMNTRTKLGKSMMEACRVRSVREYLWMPPFTVDLITLKPFTLIRNFELTLLYISYSKEFMFWQNWYFGIQCNKEDPYW